MKTSKTHRRVKILLELSSRLQYERVEHFGGRFLEWERKPTGHPIRRQFLVYECPKNAFHGKNPILRVSIEEILRATQPKGWLP